MQTCESLKKVTVTFKVATESGQAGPVYRALDFDFIYGVGVGGLCPFELQLAGKAVDESVSLRLDRNRIGVFFEHLRPPITGLFGHRDHIVISATVRRIEAAQTREIVRAVAASAGGEGGCNCGCGC